MRGDRKHRGWRECEGCQEGLLEGSRENGGLSLM